MFKTTTDKMINSLLLSEYYLTNKGEDRIEINGRERRYEVAVTKTFPAWSSRIIKLLKKINRR